MYRVWVGRFQGNRFGREGFGERIGLRAGHGAGTATDEALSTLSGLDGRWRIGRCKKKADCIPITSPTAIWYIAWNGIVYGSLRAEKQCICRDDANSVRILFGLKKLVFWSEARAYRRTDLYHMRWVSAQRRPSEESKWRHLKTRTRERVIYQYYQKTVIDIWNYT